MLVPVILSGGAGTRLWPVSREACPKPFMKLSDGQSLILKTYQRAGSVASCDAEILTVTNRDYFFMSQDEFKKTEFLNSKAGVFLLEPFGRNTAPAVAMAAIHVAERYGSEACLLVLSADHLINDSQAFARAVENAKVLAEDGYLVTFGIIPDSPETGYGYIEAGKKLVGGKAVVRFVEKPDIHKAREYLAAGTYLWNSGIFCFKAGVVLAQLAEYAPDVLKFAESCWKEMRLTGLSCAGMYEIPSDIFQHVPNISIDYALMEHSSKIAVVPSDFGWSDIGSWSAVSQLVDSDEQNNRVLGDALFVESHNTYIQSEGRFVAVVGIDSLMIIDTPDALLVTHQDKTQEVKQVVARLKELNHDVYKLHQTVARPWGTYSVIEERANFKIKRIEVKPGASLSLQMHHYRSEHWIVVNGTAKVVNGEKEFMVIANESTFIPAGTKHRLENPGIIDLVMIEVQSGEYLGEDDIIRFEDNYGRC